ncbi:MAG: alpha/beta hydrolase [Bacteroidia bacterium]
MHRHHKNYTQQGTPLAEAQKVLIMTHGRGDTAEGILGLAQYLKVKDFALLGLQATANTWYPYSFMAPVAENEPGLSSGLEVLKQIVEEVLAAGIKAENIYFLGFSQGACLTSEFLARNAHRYGGAFILSGGLIGPEIDRSNYQGDFGGMPILIGCSDVDHHIPLQRVKASTLVLQEMGAVLDERIYPNGPHSVVPDEIEAINQILG